MAGFFRLFFISLLPFQTQAFQILSLVLLFFLLVGSLAVFTLALVSFSLPLFVYVAHFFVKPLILVLLLEVDGVKVHDLIFEFPAAKFMVILLLLGRLYLRGQLFLGLD